MDELVELLRSRQALEAEMDRCLEWLNQAEVAASAEIRASNLEVLQEQLAKVTSIQENFHSKSRISSFESSTKIIMLSFCRFGF